MASDVYFIIVCADCGWIDGGHRPECPNAWRDEPWAGSDSAAVTQRPSCPTCGEYKTVAWVRCGACGGEGDVTCRECGGAGGEYFCTACYEPEGGA